MFAILCFALVIFSGATLIRSLLLVVFLGVIFTIRRSINLVIRLFFRRDRYRSCIFGHILLFLILRLGPLLTLSALAGLDKVIRLGIVRTVVPIMVMPVNLARVVPNKLIRFGIVGTLAPFVIVAFDFARVGLNTFRLCRCFPIRGRVGLRLAVVGTIGPVVLVPIFAAWVSPAFALARFFMDFLFRCQLPSPLPFCRRFFHGWRFDFARFCIRCLLAFFYLTRGIFFFSL